MVYPSRCTTMSSYSQRTGLANFQNASCWASIWRSKAAGLSVRYYCRRWALTSSATPHSEKVRTGIDCFNKVPSLVVPIRRGRMR